MEVFRPADQNRVTVAPDILRNPSSSEPMTGQYKDGAIVHAEKKFVKEEHLARAVDQANEISQLFDRSLKFEYRKEADIYQVSVIDTSKNEVVRKIPPDEIVRFIESIKDMFGAMLDVQA